MSSDIRAGSDTKKLLRRAAIVAIITWVCIAALTGPFTGKLNGETKNDNVSYLPKSADSTQVAEIQAKQRIGNELVRLVVVLQRDAGLTDSDLRYSEDVKAIVAKHTNQRIGNVQTEPSADKKSLLVISQYELPSTKGDFKDETVKKVRDEIGGDKNGLAVKVTGPAGAMYDAMKVYENINVKILLTTLLVVTVLLLIIYRSPILWLIPLISVFLADMLASTIVYALAKNDIITVNGQSAGILPILVFGAGTDYALLLVARYRDELHFHQAKWDALRIALRQTAPTILASAATVILSLLALLAADSNAIRGLGPVGAIGIACAALSMLTLLPALLLLFGRRLFWPFVPRYNETAGFQHNRWGAFADKLSRRPRPAWVLTSLALLVFAVIAFTIPIGLDNADVYPVKPESQVGQELIEKSYPKGESDPAFLLVNASGVERATQIAQGVPAVKSVRVISQGTDPATLALTLDAEPGSSREQQVIRDLRDRLQTIQSENPLVGGSGAQVLDLYDTAKRDTAVVTPIVLLIAFLILVALLRALVAPLILVATVVLSFAATLGASALFIKHVIGFEGIEVSVPLIAFVFLVALGIDYNIFLVARAREESERLGAIEGMRNALATTGGVITSAGIVLAGTFSVFLNIPLVPFIELGFIVAAGVLLDTIIVRSILVPALAFDLKNKFWWPRKLPANTNLDGKSALGERV